MTQNVDGLHARAGTPPERLIELHGTNRAVECQRCHERSDAEPHFDYFKQTRMPPICRCGGYLKAAFGQSLREQDLEEAITATKKADLVIALGSTLSVYPAASLPLLAAQRGLPM